MMLVAFDTIFEQCSLAIMMGNEVAYTKTINTTRGQTQVILPMLDEALQTLGAGVADVQAWAFNRGPGAFSGIRINTAVVQALSVANDAPCIGVSSLEALAYHAHSKYALTNNSKITTLIDARQNQLYAGDFVVQNQQIIPARADNEYLLDYDKPVSADVLVGFGVATTLVQTKADCLTLTPDAIDIARLAQPRWQQGEGVPAERALPVYLRHNAWKTLAQQKRAV